MSSRRNFIKKTGLLGAALTASSSVFGASIMTKKGNSNHLLNETDTILGHGDYRYKLTKNWAQISSTQIPLLNFPDFF